MAKAPSVDTPVGPPGAEEGLVPLLRKLPAFRGVSVEFLNQILESAHERFVTSGEFIFQQNEPASSLLIFQSGLAVEFKEVGEIDCLVGFYSEPSAIGESSFLESCNRSTSLYANEDCWITEINNDELSSLAIDFPDPFETLCVNLGRELGKKILAINEKLNRANRIIFNREAMVSWDNCL